MSSSAVTLGRYSGVALIGRPLDVQVQVLLAPGEDIANQCLAADVYYGDFQLAPNLVTAQPRSGATESDGTVRIQSSQAVNEPIVTLYVRAGCGTPFTRRFVLLADLINEPAVAGVPVVVPGAEAPVPTPLPAPAAVSPVAPAPPLAAAAPVAPAPAPAVRAPAPPPRPKVAPAPRPPAVARAPAPKPPAPTATAPVRPPATASGAPAPAGTSRLKLDPPDLGPVAERAPEARPLAGADQTGANAAAAVPSAAEVALAAANEESRRNAERLAALENEMKQFRESQQRDQARIADLTAQLMRAEEQRYQNWVVFLLAGLLMLALGAIAVLARRQKQTVVQSDASRAWWAGDMDSEEESPRVSRRAALAPSAPVPLEPLSGNEIDVELDADSSPAPLAGDSGARRPSYAPTLPPTDRRDFAPSLLGGSRAVATEELFDIQQQADFFVSLGEDDQAIAVLRNHLTESHDPSPLAYLDLFKLYHRLGRRDEYEALRDEFNRVFNAGAPPFDRYADKGRGLDAYETAMGRIQSLWPQPRVLDLIERSIFRDAEEGETEVFDLEAYRELLLLHAIASELIVRDGPDASADFQNTSMQPLKAAAREAARSQELDDSARKTIPMDLHVIPPASPPVTVDIDVDDLQTLSAFEALLPDVDVPVEPTAGRSSMPAEGQSLDFDLGFDDPAQEDAPPRPRGGQDDKA